MMPAARSQLKDVVASKTAEQNRSLIKKLPPSSTRELVYYATNDPAGVESSKRSTRAGAILRRAAHSRASSRRVASPCTPTPPPSPPPWEPAGAGPDDVCNIHRRSSADTVQHSRQPSARVAWGERTSVNACAWPVGRSAQPRSRALLES
ncbi:hypothetical protein C0Q70_19912 [Pomacea canaliculata]|uniref:Uncharacterized protein n=1 Tax=Pomacea canaliculata TaxID=400727 RepID=A0A2T7NE25_POMCA|nr:hypothetical protein C0Q70_19912 [Pomacea canaliculata]